MYLELFIVAITIAIYGFINLTINNWPTITSCCI